MIYKSKYHNIIRFHTRQSLAIFLIFITLVTVSFTLLYKQHVLQKVHQEDELQKTILNHQAHIDSLLDAVTRCVNILRIRAESDLLETRDNENSVRLMAFNFLKDAGDGRSFNLDHFDPPLKREMIGNLTGIGSVHGRGPDFYRELHMALNLNPDFQAMSKSMPSACRFYYISRNRFINCYPWTASDRLRFSGAMHSRQFFAMGLPENNPGRALYWTDLSVGHSGQGLMTTCGAPIYDGDRFLGIVAIDLDVDFLNTILRESLLESGRVFLVNDNDQIVAHSRLLFSKKDQAVDLIKVLPESVYDVLVRHKDLTDAHNPRVPRIKALQIHRYGVVTVLQSFLLNAPWRIVYWDPGRSIWRLMIDGMGSGTVVFLSGSFLLMIGVLTTTYRGFIRPSERFLHYIIVRGHGELPRIGKDVPLVWHPWFKAIEDTFCRKEGLEQEIRRQNRELKACVRLRTSDLAETQQRLRAEVEERERTENALRLIFNGVDDAIFIHEADGKIRAVNDKVLELFKVSYDEAFQFSIIGDYGDRREEKRVQDYWRRVIEGERITFEYKLKRPGDNFEFDAEIVLKKIILFKRDMILANIRNITGRKRTEADLKEKEAYLRIMMETIQTGILIVNPQTRHIEFVNPYAARLIGASPKALRGRNCLDFLSFEGNDFCPLPEAWPENIHDCRLRSLDGNIFNIRMLCAPVKQAKKMFFLQSFSDITDVETLLKKRKINIGLAKKLLELTDGIPSRHIQLNDDLGLFFAAVSIPCDAEGGDHFFVRTYKDHSRHNHTKTLVSLKDQSGHEVACLLRGIITDLIHQNILFSKCDCSLESMLAFLNDGICRYRLFAEDDFFAATHFEIDHESLALRYVSSGTPPFMLIRQQNVISLPENGDSGATLPLGIFENSCITAGDYQLQAGDKLLAFTDGLIAMPLKNRKKIISIKEIESLVDRILEHAPESTGAELIEQILMAVSDMSDETVMPEDKNSPAQNTSRDDVTLVCVEIEHYGMREETVIRPIDDDSVSRIVIELYDQLGAQWRRQGFETPEIRLRMVLEETLLNAWKHGNRRDPQKSITIQWRLGNDFHLMVSDEGNGFDYQALIDPTRPIAITREYGRGIYIIKHYADYVTWKRDGREIHVYFAKKNDGSDTAKNFFAHLLKSDIGQTIPS